MLGVLAVVLCRLLVTCAGVAVGVLDSGVCATVLPYLKRFTLVYSVYAVLDPTLHWLVISRSFVARGVVYPWPVGAAAVGPLAPPVPSPAQW